MLKRNDLDIEEHKKFIYAYKITNTIDNTIYVGIHGTNNLDDGYMGSGSYLKRAIKKYGRKKFTKEILQYFKSYKEALDYEAVIVTKEFIERHDTYNLKEGGFCNYEWSDEYKRNQSIAIRGSELCRNKIKILNKNPEKIRKMAESHTGMKRTEESKKKMSDAGKGKHDGILNGWFKGWYITPKGKFESLRKAGKEFDSCDANIDNWCVRLNSKKIVKGTILRRPDLFDLSMLGKTWKELGWGFDAATKKERKVKYDTLKENTEYEILTSEGFKDFKGIVTSKAATLILTFDDNSTLECTKKHRIFYKTKVGKRYKYAQSFKIGDNVVSKDGFKTIIKIEKVQGAYQTVYEILQVSDNNEYYTNDILSHNCLVLDEYAHVPPNIQDDFMSSVIPTTSSGKTSKIIIMSTPNGTEMFYNIWTAAVRGQNSYYPIKVLWSDIPGRDAAWRKRIIDDLPGGLDSFLQEYDCRFIGSANSLIDTDKLEKFKYKPYLDTKWSGLMKIYEYPIVGCKYVIGVDTAGGGGQLKSNYSVIQVIKIKSKQDLEQVAIYRCNTVNPYDFAIIVKDVSNYYNDASAMIENNADVGGILLATLWNDLEFDKIVNISPKWLGVKATSITKSEGNMLLKRYLESGWLTLWDKDTIHELSMYQEVRLGIFKAQRDSDFDDCVTSLIWAVYYTKTDEFSDLNMDDIYRPDVVRDDKNYEMMAIFD
jgi:hypothetical protein